MSEREIRAVGRVEGGRVVVPAAHTPGPWYACYSSTDEFPGGNIRSDNHADGTGALLFTTGPMFHDYTLAQGEELANLRLVAAAPAMLEALRAVERWVGLDAIGVIRDSLLPEVRTVIAAATQGVNG